jgi:hypothetical protein
MTQSLKKAAALICRDASPVAPQSTALPIKRSILPEQIPRPTGARPNERLQGDREVRRKSPLDAHLPDCVRRYGE